MATYCGLLVSFSGLAHPHPRTSKSTRPHVSAAEQAKPVLMYKGRIREDQTRAALSSSFPRCAWCGTQLRWSASWERGREHRREEPCVSGGLVWCQRCCAKGGGVVRKAINQGLRLWVHMRGSVLEGDPPPLSSAKRYKHCRPLLPHGLSFIRPQA